MVNQPTPPMNACGGSGYSNPNFILDDSQPPPYHLIYPELFNATESNKNSKAQSSTIILTNNYSIYENNNDETAMPSSYVYPPRISSCRFLFQNVDETLPPPLSSSITNPNISQSYSHRNENLVRENKMRKQFGIHFSKSYLHRHYFLVICISLSLIGMQVVLMNFNALLSQLGSGVYCGLFNLVTLLFGLITSK
jgi:hypothetical protein